MDISYEYYRIFYYVASCGSVSQAAAQLRNNQPNLTRAIKNLEGELGCTLFLRTNRGMRLTPEGEQMMPYIHEIVRQEKLLRQGIHITDDAMVVETLMRHPVKLTEGSYQNIKITTPEDLAIAEAFLRY